MYYWVKSVVLLGIVEHVITNKVVNSTALNTTSSLVHIQAFISSIIPHNIHVDATNNTNTNMSNVRTQASSSYFINVDNINSGTITSTLYANVNMSVELPGVVIKKSAISSTSVVKGPTHLILAPNSSSPVKKSNTKINSLNVSSSTEIVNLIVPVKSTVSVKVIESNSNNSNRVQTTVAVKDIANRTSKSVFESSSVMTSVYAGNIKGSNMTIHKNSKTKSTASTSEQFATPAPAFISQSNLEVGPQSTDKIVQYTSANNMNASVINKQFSSSLSVTKSVIHQVPSKSAASITIGVKETSILPSYSTTANLNSIVLSKSAISITPTAKVNKEVFHTSTHSRIIQGASVTISQQNSTVTSGKSKLSSPSIKVVQSSQKSLSPSSSQKRGMSPTISKMSPSLSVQVINITHASTTPKMKHISSTHVSKSKYVMTHGSPAKTSILVVPSESISLLKSTSSSLIIKKSLEVSTSHVKNQTEVIVPLGPDVTHSTGKAPLTLAGRIGIGVAIAAGIIIIVVLIYFAKSKHKINRYRRYDNTYQIPGFTDIGGMVQLSTIGDSEYEILDATDYSKGENPLYDVTSQNSAPRSPPYDNHGYAKNEHPENVNMSNTNSTNISNFATFKN